MQVSICVPLVPVALMYVYKAHMDKGWFGCAIEELGPRRLADAKALIASLKELDNENIIMDFYKFAKPDFVEVSYVGNDVYLVYSDRITPSRSLLARLLGSRHIERFVQGDEEAFKAVEFYMERPREEFEERYKRASGDRLRW